MSTPSDEDQRDLYKFYLHRCKIELRPLLQFYTKQILVQIKKRIKRKANPRTGWSIKFSLPIPYSIFEKWYGIIDGYKTRHGRTTDNDLKKPPKQRKTYEISFWHLGTFKHHLGSIFGENTEEITSAFVEKGLRDNCKGLVKATKDSPIKFIYKIKQEILTVSCFYFVENMYQYVVV